MNPLKTLAEKAGLPEALRDTGEIFSRRRMLMGGFLAAAGAASPARAAPRPSPARWLVNRITMGLNEQELILAESLGYHGYLEYQLNHTAIDDTAFEQRISGYLLHLYDPNNILNNPSYRVTNQLVDCTILRGIFSKRQLYARTVEFWSEHFSLFAEKELLPWFKIHDDRDVVRAHALGKFPDMLMASMKSPSMLIYLDNYTSVAGNPNENYARELLELHTLGVDGGYTQQDVQEVARCLTGWTLFTAGPQRWTFWFDSSRHDNGQKTVLGHTIPAGGGMNDGLMVHNILVNHPSTANFIAKKLCRWFHSYTPPQSLIDAVAATYTATGGDIKEMIRTLFNTLDPTTAPAKFKRPYHMFISSLRAMGAEMTSDPAAGISAIRDRLRGAGHEPHHRIPPDGYPDKIESWVGLLLPRWNFAFQAARNVVDRITFDVTTFMQGAATADAVVSRIDAALFGSAMPAADKTRIRDYLLAYPLTTDRMREAVALALSSPGFQWY